MQEGEINSSQSKTPTSSLPTGPQVDPAYAPMLSVLFDIRNLVASDASQLSANNPNWDPRRDARITVFWNALTVIESAGIGLVFVKGTLREEHFWQGCLGLDVNEGQSPVVATEYLERGLESFVKLGLIQLLFSVVESAFRSYLRALDPAACGRGTAEFQSIYRCLLQSHLSVTPSNAIDLLELWREVRNVVHNNGVYFKRRDTSDTTIVYKGQTYTFRYGQKIEFIDWKMLLRMVFDLRELLLQVVNDEKIKGVAGLISDLSQQP